MESLMWIMAMVPVVCLGSLRGIGWLTGGVALIIALACPEAMATVGALSGVSVVVAMIAITMEQLCGR